MERCRREIDAIEAELLAGAVGLVRRISKRSRDEKSRRG
jgi:hypothetical protein